MRVTRTSKCRLTHRAGANGHCAFYAKLRISCGTKTGSSQSISSVFPDTR
jgi:hypothetical protein